MPAHYCIDPLDPYAEREVLISYEEARPFVFIRTAIDQEGCDILPDMSDECRRMLQLEIAVYHGLIQPCEWAQHAIDVLSAPNAA